MDVMEEDEGLCCSGIILEEDKKSLEKPSCHSSKEKGIKNSICQNHTGDFNCDKTEVTYLKLQNKVLKEEIKFIKIEPAVLMVLNTLLSSDILLERNTTELENLCTDLPPIKFSSLDFLIQIQQLKIPNLA